MKASRALVWLGLALWPAIASASFDSSAMRQKYVVGATHQTMGWTGAEARDVDGIAGDEILVGYANMWHLLRWNDPSQTFDQLGFSENSYTGPFGEGGTLVSVRFADFDHRAPLQVAVLDVKGQIGRFELDGSLHTPLWKPPVTDIARMLIGDLDGQPGDEILLQSCTELSAWKFGAATPLWRIPMQHCEHILLAQLDRDPQLEIVLGSGTVIDTKTLQTQWRYPIGFGSVLTSGDLDGDGVRELIGCDGRRCDAFDVVRQTTIWETFLPSPQGVGCLTTADVDGDGKAEIFEGDEQAGSIRKISGATGTLLQEIKNEGNTNFVLIADLRSDCRKELVWARDGDTTNLDTMHTADAVTMRPLWSSVQEERGASGVLVADFSGTGHPSIFWPSAGGTVERFVSFNPPAHALKEISGNYDTYALYLPVSAAAQLDSDPAIEYILPVGFLPTDIGVFDGSTHQLQWSVPVVPIGDTISSLTTGDVNGDGVADIIVGSSIQYFPKRHPEAVIAVDGATRKILWQTTDTMSHDLDFCCDGCTVEVKVADLAGNGSKEVLALVPSDGLFAFDGRNGTLLWTTPLAAESDHLFFKAWAFTVSDIDPSPGAEIIVPLMNGRMVVFDSSATRVLRTKDLSSFGTGLALEVADLDGDGQPEIVVLTQGGLVVLSAATLDVLWSGGFVLTGYSLGNQIAIADVDGDGTPEIVVASAHSLRVFEYRANKADVTPPLFGSAAIRLGASTGCCRVAFDWDPASDAQSMPVKYRIYRSVVPGFVPGPSSRVGETSETTFIDRSLVQGPLFYYAVTAVDSAGNESSSTLRISMAAPADCPARIHAVRTP